MPAEIVDVLFDFNAKSTRKGTEGEKGSGYGIPHAKRYTESLKGHIKVESVEKEGTTFKLSFPLSN